MSTKQERFEGIDAAVFRTITGDDWRRSLAMARSEPNLVLEQIQQKILALKLGKTPFDRLRAGES